MSEWVFRTDHRLERMEKFGDPLTVLADQIPWESFRKELNRVREVKSARLGGPLQFDVVMMFKIIILQGLYNLSDKDIEYQIADRLSFQRFLGIEPNQNIPDSNTIWNFRERMKNKRLLDRLFTRFDFFLRESGIEAKKGRFVEATFAQDPVRPDTPEDNQSIDETCGSPEK